MQLSIIKIGGNIIDDETKLEAFLEAFAVVKGRKILVHGGGKLATRVATGLGVQQQMIDKAFELLSEHFDHVVIAVGTYDEDKQYTTTASYYGGVAPAIGLCKLYEKRWTKEHLWGPDDELE